MFGAKHFAGRIGLGVGAAIAIGVGNAVDLWCKRSKASLIGCNFAGERHGEKRAAVECVFKRDYGRPFGVGACDLDGVFDGFGAGIDKHGFFWSTDRSEGIQFFGERDVGLVRSYPKAEMEETVDLIVKGIGDERMAVSNVQAANATRKIEVTIAIDVFDPRAMGLRGKNGCNELRSARYGGFAASE